MISPLGVQIPAQLGALVETELKSLTDVNLTAALKVLDTTLGYNVFDIIVTVSRTFSSAIPTHTRCALCSTWSAC